MTEVVETNEPKLTLEGGATRSEAAPRYDLVPKDAIDAIANRLAYGAGIHGEHNWEKGGADFVAETERHLINHALAYIHGHDLEDLEAIGANFAMLRYFRRKGIVGK